jgi:hypothetical protein
VNWSCGIPGRRSMARSSGQPQFEVRARLIVCPEQISGIRETL